MIHNTNQLNQQQLKDLEILCAACKKIDDSIPCIYPHILIQHRTLPASLLYYDKDQLIGFLSVYFFYEDAVEVGLLVHPAHRKQGIAKELILGILPLLEFQNYFTLIFSSPAYLNNSWLQARDYTYKHSEYHMERNELNPILEYSQPLTFQIATVNDIPTLDAIDKQCFPNKQNDNGERLRHILDNRSYEIYLAFYKDKPVGKTHIRWQEKGATLSDIAIIPSHQGKRLGSTLIAHCINLILSEGKSSVTLDVETHNSRALNLYTQLGFVTQNACDFWSVDREQLKASLT